MGAWQPQQQQQQQEDTSESASSSTRKLVQREEQGTPTDNPEPPSIWKRMRGAESLVEKEECEFKVDLRIEGIAQDVIQENEQRMGQFQKVADKLRTGYRTKSIVEDLGKPERSIKFSEESSRTIRELGDIELHELGQISRTVQ